MTNSELRERIAERINGTNAARNRKLLLRRLIDGVHIEPLAEEFDLSVTQTRRIIKSGKEIIYDVQKPG